MQTNKEIELRYSNRNYKFALCLFINYSVLYTLSFFIYSQHLNNYLQKLQILKSHIVKYSIFNTSYYSA